MSSNNIPHESLKRILVVDDESNVTLFFKTVLNDNGFYVDTFNDPVKALSRFKPQFYAIVFIDMRMPHLNGFQFFRLLRKKDRQVKVCFLTAFQSYYNSLKDEHPGLNVKCFIRKPIETEELLSIVRRELIQSK